jgi:hypothetical protein
MKYPDEIIARFGLIAVACLIIGCNAPEQERPNYDFSILTIEKPSVSKLLNNETVTVDVLHTGCIDYRKNYRYEIEGPSPLHVIAYERKAEEDSEWNPIGEFELSEIEASRFDRLIAFYRKQVDGWCTTKDHVTIRWKTTTEPELFEEYHDSTCMARDDPAILPIWELSQRARHEI